MASLDDLCEQVKDMQRNDQVGKENWIAYCSEYGEGKRDPRAHDEDFISSFFEAYKAGSINVADSEPFKTTNNQLFIGALAEGTTKEMVQEYFESWLEVKRIDFKDDRGFCFVTFADSSAASQVMETFDQHEINGKIVECKRAEDRRPKENDGKGYGKDKGYGGKSFGGKDKGYGGKSAGGKDKGYGGKDKGYGGKSKGKGYDAKEETYGSKSTSKGYGGDSGGYGKGKGKSSGKGRPSPY
eukprot:GEMP01054657.1.p1 GENE.GEMP01054657.1~~GEMP01054657.1.p1  ORF type:complete len:257 (+),score=66.64 GEMP01054657.1:49-771(+)